MQVANIKIRPGAIVSFARPRIRRTGANGSTGVSSTEARKRNDQSQLTHACMTSPGKGQCTCGTTRNWFERVTA